MSADARRRARGCGDRVVAHRDRSPAAADAMGGSGSPGASPLRPGAPPRTAYTIPFSFHLAKMRRHWASASLSAASGEAAPLAALANITFSTQVL